MDAVSSASLNLKNSELTGNTELIAQEIWQETGGELFRIESEKKYPADYDELVDYGRNEPEEDSRPALVSHVEDMESYDVIFLGFQIGGLICPWQFTAFWMNTISPEKR